MIYFILCIANFVCGSEYQYMFYTDIITPDRSYTETSNKTFDQFYKSSVKNNKVKIVQIRAALEYISTQDASLYSLKKYVHKKDANFDAQYQFFTQLLKCLRDKKFDGLIITPEIIAEPEKYFLGTTQPKHAITYRFENMDSYIFSLHVHDHQQKILLNCIDASYLLGLKNNTNRFALDIIETSSQRVIGMALFDFPVDETLYVSRLYIASNHRKTGLGTNALNCIARFAAIRKANRIELHIQPFGYYKAAGSELLQWYKKVGFKIINTTSLLAKKAIPESIPLEQGRVEILFT